MKKTVCFILLVFVLKSCAWSPGQQILYTTYAVGQAVDYAQTQEFLKDDSEANPVIIYIEENYGHGGVALLKVSYLLGCWLVADRLPPAWRTRLLLLTNSLTWGIVVRNDGVGLW